METEILKRNGLLHLTLYQWLHQSPRNVVHEDYYGNMLNGPNCDKVLKRQTLMDMYDFLPPELHKYVNALRALDTLKKAKIIQKRSLKFELSHLHNYFDYHV